MRYLISSWFIISTLACTSPAFAAKQWQTQSEFVGPVTLKVWRHWQASWNVELDADQPQQKFVLRRGHVFDTSGNQEPRIQLEFKESDGPLEVKIQGTAYFRSGSHQTSEGSLSTLYGQAEAKNGIAFFDLSAPDYLDESGTRIVTSIEFEVLRSGQRIFHYRVVPAYVRGAKNYYWKHRIDPVMAHNGKGEIWVANATDAEHGLDHWDGRPVLVTEQFVDRNILGAGAEIGLHRHERNQEKWVIEVGSAQLTNGVAHRTSADYRVERIWDSSGARQEVDQFDAQGYLETRGLAAGDFSVIVPDPNQVDAVCFHGLLALAGGAQTYTEGTKN